jgi:hypothetical protein
VIDGGEVSQGWKQRPAAASSQQPAASSQQPAASSQQPAAGSQQPAAGSQQPAASSQQPAAAAAAASSDSIPHGVRFIQATPIACCESVGVRVQINARRYSNMPSIGRQRHRLRTMLSTRFVVSLAALLLLLLLLP